MDRLCAIIEVFSTLVKTSIMILFQTIFRKFKASGFDWITISFADLPSISHIVPWQNNSVEIPLRANMLLQMWSRRLLWHTLTVAGTCSTASYCGCHDWSGTDSKPRSIAVILSYNTMLSMIFLGFFYIFSYIYMWIYIILVISPHLLILPWPW